MNRFSLVMLLFLFLCFFLGRPLMALDVSQESRISGVTLDDISNITTIVDAIKSLPTKMTVRIVFDSNVSPSYYTTAVTELHKVAYIQGEILDSYFVRDYTVQEYIDRTNQYLDAFGGVVDIWEVGNEINGEWLMNNNNTTDVVNKMVGAYNAVKNRGYKAALTLYYNGTYNNGIASTTNCWAKSTNQMSYWANANIPSTMKQGLDFVWVSYYEQDCENYNPDWKTVFTDLALMFPNSKLGIGECGSMNPLTGAATGAEQTLIDRYYLNMSEVSANLDKFVWGGFWWFFIRDMVPKTKSLWSYFNTTLLKTINPVSPTPTPTPTPISTPTPTPMPTATTIYTSRVKNIKGDTTGLISSMQTQDQSGYMWTQSKILQINIAGTSGAEIQFSSIAPSTLSLSSLKSINIKVNFASSTYAKQKWYFEIWDFNNSKWIMLGNNGPVIAGTWTPLSWTLTSSLINYINSNTKEIRLRLRTPSGSGLRGSAIDFLSFDLF